MELKMAIKTMANFEETKSKKGDKKVNTIGID